MTHPASQPRPRVGLFVTCLVDLFRPSVGFAAVKLLEDAGCDVEVPGMQTPAPVLAAMRAAPSREAQREVGIEVARETLAAVKAHPRVRGVYVYPPFGSYRAVLRVLEGIVDGITEPGPAEASLARPL